MIIEQIATGVVAPRNTFVVEHIRGGKVLSKDIITNGVTLERMNSMLNTYFGADVKKAAWAIGLVDASGYSAEAETDTMATHAGWLEFTNYNEATRPTWEATVSSAKSITGTGVQTFTIGTVVSQSILGLMVSDSNTKGGTTGMLWSTALFSSAKPVVTADTFRVTYTLRLGN